MTPPTSDLDVVLAACDRAIARPIGGRPGWAHEQKALARLVKAFLTHPAAIEPSAYPASGGSIFGPAIEAAAREIRGEG